jgi:predicted DNA-binding transcriptional regulator AlpA
MQNVSVERNTTNTISRLLNSDEVSELLGVRKSTLSYWRCTGRYNLRWVKVGRLAMYRPEDVNAFIESRTVQLKEA